jgi:hypothetical protein
MKPVLEQEIQIEVPLHGELNSVLTKKYLSPFNNDVVAFVVSLSQKLLSDKETKKMSELVALAFWMRRKNILELKEDFYRRAENSLLPRGLAFHIVPSNVDTIFIYSLFLSMFCGNSNIVRLSSQFNPQVEALVRILNESLVDFPILAERMLLVRYDHNDEITEFFSKICDLRMIWGGDETIRRIRKLPLSPGAKELTFADRFSLAVLDSKSYNEYEQKDGLISAFFNDTYWFNQMACSSPRLICWVGDNLEETLQAQDDFWLRLHQYILSHTPEIAPFALMDKYLTQCIYAVEASHLSIIQTGNNFITRIQISYGEDFNRDLHCGNGLFIETRLDKLEDLVNIIERKDQTLTAFGFSNETLIDFVENKRPRGIDRIVPFGEALSFSSVWDGYDLLFEMTRSVTVKT